MLKFVMMKKLALNCSQQARKSECVQTSFMDVQTNAAAEFSTGTQTGMLDLVIPTARILSGKCELKSKFDEIRK